MYLGDFLAHLVAAVNNIVKSSTTLSFNIQTEGAGLWTED